MAGGASASSAAGGGKSDAGEDDGDGSEDLQEGKDLMAELGESVKRGGSMQQDMTPPSPTIDLVNRVAVGCISLFGQSVDLALEMGDKAIAASPWGEC